jgi:16S rRNA (adenine1518-N6/adenine1519-N6)-dimethyltransferase
VGQRLGQHFLIKGSILERIDPYLVEHLRTRYTAEVFHADVLSTDLAQWGAAVIAGNLPYYITSPILEKVLPLDFRRAVFLMQKEVAERLVAQPGSRDYGYLTVQTALFAHARLLFTVKPSAFHPPPKVDSAVVLLERRPPAVDDIAGFLRFAGRCFRYKRKTIRNNLGDVPGIEAWPEAGLRAEQIGMKQFLTMYARLPRG